mgnify:CR=1 FL=1|jgi:hypothetical protein
MNSKKSDLTESDFYNYHFLFYYHFPNYLSLRNISEKLIHLTLKT